LHQVFTKKPRSTPTFFEPLSLAQVFLNLFYNLILPEHQIIQGTIAGCGGGADKGWQGMDHISAFIVSAHIVVEQCMLM
jgi:hypothetical protein